MPVVHIDIRPALLPHFLLQLLVRVIEMLEHLCHVTLFNSSALVGRIIATAICSWSDLRMCGSRELYAFSAIDGPWWLLSILVPGV